MTNLDQSPTWQGYGGLKRWVWNMTPDLIATPIAITPNEDARLEPFTMDTPWRLSQIYGKWDYEVTASGKPAPSWTLTLYFAVYRVNKGQYGTTPAGLRVYSGTQAYAGSGSSGPVTVYTYTPTATSNLANGNTKADGLYWAYFYWSFVSTAVPPSTCSATINAWGTVENLYGGGPSWWYASTSDTAAPDPLTTILGTDTNRIGFCLGI